MTAFSKCIPTLIQILEVLRHFFYFWWSLSAVASLAFQMYRARLKGGPQVAWMLQARPGEVVRNSSNKIYQTWGPAFCRPLCICHVCLWQLAPILLEVLWRAHVGDVHLWIRAVQGFGQGEDAARDQRVWIKAAKTRGLSWHEAEVGKSPKSIQKIHIPMQKIQNPL